MLSSVKDLPVKVYLYGSRATGEERRTSDIDVGIWSESPLSARLPTDIRFSLEESTIPCRVDVVDVTRSDPSFVKEGKKGRYLMERLKERNAVAEQAFNTFEEVMEIIEPTTIERDAAIQRFEFTFEAIWKTAKQMLFEIDRTYLQ